VRAIIASPFNPVSGVVFIAPAFTGRRNATFCLLTATVGLFLAARFFGYHYVYPVR